MSSNKMEISCGAVIYTLIDDAVHYVIIYQLNGFHGFPKGHMEQGESQLETARREILEETGLKVDFIDGFKQEVTYPLPQKPGVTKKVIYFLARYQDQQPVFQESEVQDLKLLEYDDALRILEYDNSKGVLKKAHEFLREKGIEG